MILHHMTCTRIRRCLILLPSELVAIFLAIQSCSAQDLSANKEKETILRLEQIRNAQPEEAIKQFKQLVQEGKTDRALRQILCGQFRNPVTFLVAYHALADIGETAVPELRQLLSPKGNAQVRGYAARLVARSAAESKAPLDRLKELLKDDVQEVRGYAVHEIGQLQSKEALHVLMEIIRVRKDHALTSGAFTAIGAFKTMAEEAMPMLIEIMLAGGKDEWSDRAGRTLAHLGEKSVHVLGKMVRDKSLPLQTRWLALEALQEMTEIHGTEVVGTEFSTIVGALEDSEEKIRLEAVAVLRSLEKIAVKALPSIRKHMKDSSFDVRLSATMLVLSLVPNDPEAKAALRAHLQALTSFSAAFGCSRFRLQALHG